MPRQRLLLQSIRASAARDAQVAWPTLAPRQPAPPPPPSHVPVRSAGSPSVCCAAQGSGSHNAVAAKRRVVLLALATVPVAGGAWSPARLARAFGTDVRYACCPVSCAC